MSYTPGQLEGSSIGAAGTADIGSYVVQVTDASNDVYYLSVGSLSVTADGFLINLSARALVGTGGNVLIAGFVTEGPGNKSVLIRADGPSLTAFGITGALLNPQLELHNTSDLLQTTIGWDTNLASVFDGVGAFSWDPGSADSAQLHTISSGGYTAIVSGATGTTGVALAEVYDADAASNSIFDTSFSGPPTNRLVNISARANVGTGSNVLIGGFAFVGTTSKTFLIREAGPALSLPPFNLAGTLASINLTLYDDGGQVIASNQGWTNPIALGNSTLVNGSHPKVGVESATSNMFVRVGASGTWSQGSGDSAILVTLPPGSYTVSDSGKNGATGVSLIEIYEVVE